VKKSIKEKWVAALRSNDYKQGIGSLRDGDTYCCLGVLCDVVNPRGWRKDGFSYKKKKGDIILPHTLSEELGVTPTDQSKLSNMNDSGFNFDSIADYIEENL
jgi:hypothetical protein